MAHVKELNIGNSLRVTATDIVSWTPQSVLECSGIPEFAIFNLE